MAAPIEVSIVLAEGVERPVALADVAGEVVVAFHCVGVLSETTVVAHPLDHVLLVVRGADPGVSPREVELRDVLDAGSGGAKLDEIVDDAIVDLRERNAGGCRPVGVTRDRDVRVTRSALARGVQAVEESGQLVRPLLARSRCP